MDCGTRPRITVGRDLTLTQTPIPLSDCSKVANSGPDAAKENETQERERSGKAEKDQPRNQRSKTDEKMGVREQKKFKPLIGRRD